jgi:transposase InsO family protein
MPAYDRDAEKKLESAKAMAQFRYDMISPVINRLISDASAMDYYRRVCSVPLKRPDGTEFRYNPKTLERWKSTYETGGMDALISKTRSDLGKCRKLSKEAIERIRELRELFPKISSVLIREKLLQEMLIPVELADRTIQRFVKRERIMNDESDGKDRKAFEFEHFGILYQADTSFFPYIAEEGEKGEKRTYLIRILDDHSRLTVGAELFYEDNAANFQKVLKKTCAAYGIPRMLYVDLGSPYNNNDLRFICANLGISLIHTPVKDGASKGKIEKSFLDIKQRWLYGFDTKTVHSLAEFNGLLIDEIRKRNLEVNKSTGEPPIERYQKSENHTRMPESQQWLDEAFMYRVTRLVHKDATIKMKPYLFDAPRQFIGKTVEVRYLTGEPDKAFMIYESKRYPLQVTNKVDNSKAKRQNTYKIDYSKERQQ